uniref:Serine/threonine-protein kinase rio2 n=1 Tax=Rhizophora mucronata TaxID=61149 RepID=A0A2P2LQZ6_RHIMU
MHSSYDSSLTFLSFFPCQSLNWHNWFGDIDLLVVAIQLANTILQPASSLHISPAAQLFLNFGVLGGSTALVFV